LTVTMGGFSISVNFAPFHVPDVLGSTGSLVWDGISKEMYVVEGIRYNVASSPKDPCWFYTVDSSPYGYDQALYDQNFVIGDSDTIKCSTDEVNCQLVADVMSTHLVEQAKIAYYIDKTYEYSNFTFAFGGSFSSYRLNKPLTVLATVVTNVSNVAAVKTVANAIVVEAGTTGICYAGNRGLWVYGHNLGDFGVTSCVIKDGADEYNMGQYLIRPGPFNITTVLPNTLSNGTYSVCLESLEVSCVNFVMDCVAPLNPHSSSTGGTVFEPDNPWLWSGAAALVLIIVIGCVLYCCCQRQLRRYTTLF